MVWRASSEADPGDRGDTNEVVKTLTTDRVGEDHAGTLLDPRLAIDEAVTAGETIVGLFRISPVRSAKYRYTVTTDRLIHAGQCVSNPDARREIYTGQACSHR